MVPQSPRHFICFLSARGFPSPGRAVKGLTIGGRDSRSVERSGWKNIMPRIAELQRNSSVNPIRNTSRITDFLGDETLVVDERPQHSSSRLVDEKLNRLIKQTTSYFFSQKIHSQ